MQNETEEQHKERKDMFISFVISKSKGMVEDEAQLIKEAGAMFDKANPLLTDSLVRLYKNKN